ncbi:MULTISPECIES: hypothetical protein, partial [unclassified Endozoicomonas]|uniref:hypothetical protein n=1 Tax=unclassified Endozoicomonas TaxID=2644528 RepID=UPI002147BB19
IIQLELISLQLYLLASTHTLFYIKIRYEIVPPTKAIALPVSIRIELLSCLKVKSTYKQMISMQSFRSREGE